MTVLSTSRTAGPFPGNGSQTAFPFTMRVFAQADLVVLETDAEGAVETLVLSSDYTCSINADQNTSPGGTITLLSPLAVDHTLDLTTDIQATQETNITNASGFYPRVIENMADKLTVLHQQQRVVGAQALRVPDTSGVSLLPAAAGRAGLIPVFDAAGDVTVSGFTTAEIEAAILASYGIPTILNGYERQTATAAQTVFTLASTTYTPGSYSLQVYVNGIRLYPGTDYTETSATSVTFAVPRALNDDVLFDTGRTLNVGMGGTTVAYLAGGTGASARSVSAILDERIRVDDYIQVGDTNDLAAVQRAINRAVARMPTDDASAPGIEIQFAPRTYDFGSGSATLTTRGGITFSGTGRGATVQGTGTLFDIGSATQRLTKITFQNLVFLSSSTSSTTAIGIRIYRAQQTTILQCRFAGLYIGVDCYRSTNAFIEGCYFQNSTRTAQALAHIRMQGTDETAFASPETYTPGGGLHLVGCEFKGASGSGDTLSGLLVMSADGLYVTQCHWTGCITSIDIAPDATPANHTIVDLMFVNCYTDEPSSYATSRNVQIRGSARETITMASGATQATTYSAIKFTQCLFRGASVVDRNVFISLTDADSWWDHATRRFAEIRFDGCTFRSSTTCALQLQGAGTPAIEAHNVQVVGCHFRNHAGLSLPGYGTAITASVESILISGNTFGPDDGASAYVISVGPTDLGNDTAIPSVVITGNDLSECDTNFTIEPINVPESNVAARVLVTNNLLPGPGRKHEGLHKVTTTNATPATIWSYVIPTGAGGEVEVLVVGTSADGAKNIRYSFEAGFRRNGGGSSLSTGTANFTPVRSWNPDAFATVPTADLSGNTLRVIVTGIAATTIDWVARVELIRSH